MLSKMAGFLPTLHILLFLFSSKHSKKHMLRILTLVIITFSFTLGQKSDAQAQKGFEKTLVMSEGEDDLMADANFFFDKGNYSAATYMFQKLYMHFEGRFEYKLRLGICYTYTPTKTDLALTLLEEIYAHRHL